MRKEILKILVVGPPKSGKTTYVDLICSDSETQPNKQKTQPRRPYEPTICRILETEAHGSKVELWDIGGLMGCGSNHASDNEVGGGRRCEHLWKAITQGLAADGTASSNARVDGVILLFDNEDEIQSKEILAWYDEFVRRGDVPDKSCMVLCPSRNPQSVQNDNFRLAVPRQLRGCKVHATKLMDGEEEKNKLSDFVRDIVSKVWM